jgi:hypothetical protein
MMHGGRGWLMVQALILGILTLLAASAQAEDAKPVILPDSLVVDAIKTLMKEERTEALCVLVQDGTKFTNISQLLYSGIKREHPRFFECAGSETTFIVGPMRQDKDRGAILDIKRVLDDSPCMYQVKKHGKKWKLKKLPCVVL